MDSRSFLGQRRSSLDSSSRSDSLNSFSSAKQSSSAEFASDSQIRSHHHQRQSHVRIRSPPLDHINNDKDDDDDCSLEFSVDYNKYMQQQQQQHQKKNQEDVSMRTITTLRDESTNSLEYELHQQHHPKTQDQHKQHQASGNTATTAESTSGGEEDKRDNNRRRDDDKSKTTTTSITTTTPGPNNLKRSRITTFREVCGHFINNNRIQVTIIFLIIANALMMGLGTFDFVTENENVKAAFETTDMVFLIIFTIEIGLQLVYHGRQLFLDGWLLFDFLIVIISWCFDSLQVIRAFRIFRAVRLVTRLEILKNLVQAIFDVAPSLMAILLLLMLVLYIYAVMCTVLFKNLFEMGVTDLDYFGRLDKTLFSLFQMMTLEGWGHIVRQVMTEYYWSPFIFLSFLVFSSFILYSLIIAVVCDAVTETEHHDEYERAELAKEEMREHIKYLEKRIQEMTHQQAVLLKSLQQVMEQVEFQPQPSKSTVKSTSSWRWYRRSSDQ